MSDFKAVFGDKNGKFGYNTLMINKLPEYSKHSKNCVRRVFFERFEKFYILLIISNLSLKQKFRLFAVNKKSSEMLNFHFGRKYHFVKSGNGISACFNCFQRGIQDSV